MIKAPFTCVAAVTLAAFAGAADARPALKDVAEVREGIIAVGMAYEISEQCNSLRPRMLRGLSYLNSLKSLARSMGYSNAEIDAYVDDDAEKDRLEGIARSRLAALGAVPGEGESYCTVGRSEMASGSAIGRLLR